MKGVELKKNKILCHTLAEVILLELRQNAPPVVQII